MISLRNKKFPATRSRIILYYWMPVVLYCLLIFVQSGFPALIPLPANLPRGDKILHFTAYGLLGMLFFRAFRASCKKKSICFLLFLSIISSAFYGALDEFRQSFITWRTADAGDFLADMAGSAAGAVLYSFFPVRENLQENKIAD
ncbi:MAG: VanZ family protein [Desulfococcaceae bacterium]|nr:VanZ family protein [Desulfococcaceae bacterium]